MARGIEDVVYVGSSAPRWRAAVCFQPSFALVRQANASWEPPVLQTERVGLLKEEEMEKLFDIEGL